MPKRNNTLALAFLDKYRATPKTKPKKVRAQAKQLPEGTDAKTGSKKGGQKAAIEREAIFLAKHPEIILSEPRYIAGPLPAMPDVPTVNLGPIEESFRSMSELLDLSKTEGFLDRVFGRPNHRIEVKTERALRLADYRAALTRNVEEMRKAMEELAGVNRARFALAAEAYTAEERLQYERNVAARQDAIEAAKAKAEIAKYLAEAELARRSALPPPPPEPLLLPPPDPGARNKARLKEEIERLSFEEREEIDRITAGKSEAEWSEEIKDEVVRAQNMYADARDVKRDELRRYL